MKKILSILLCLVMALGLAVPAMAEGYTAGTYTASADGNNGPVTVEVDFDENAITGRARNGARRDRGHLRNAYRADSRCDR